MRPLRSIRVITVIVVLVLLTSDFWPTLAARAQKQHKRNLRARRKERPHSKTVADLVSITTVQPTEAGLGFVNPPTTITTPVSIPLLSASKSTTPSYVEQSVSMDSAPSDKQIMEEVLKKYRFPDPAVNISVGVSLKVERVLGGEQRVDDLCRLQLLIRQKWMEPRLEFKQLRESSNPIRLRSPNYVWNPALIVENALRVVSVGKDTLEVSPGGVVEQQQRLQVIVEAETDFHWTFPFERRNCTLRLANEDPRAVWGRVLEVELPSPIDRGSSLFGFLVPHGNASAVAEFIVESARMRAHHTVEIRMRLSIVPWLVALFLPTLALLAISCGPWAERAPLLRLACFAGVLATVHASASYAPRTGTIKAIDEWNVGVQLLAVFFLATCRGWRNVVKDHTRNTHQINGYYEEVDSSAQGRPTSRLPYYTQLRENKPKNGVACGNCGAILCRVSVRILNPVLLLIFLAYFTVRHAMPYYRG